MIQNVLSAIGGIGVFGVISILIFFVFFGGMLVWAWRLKKPYLSTMSELPLESNSQISPKGPESHE